MIWPKWCWKVESAIKL